MKLIDLTGCQFGRLTVLGRNLESGTKHVAWNVRCQCGVTKIANGDGMKKGAIKSCGCLRRDMGTWNKGVTGPRSHSFHGNGEVPLSYFTELRYKAKGRDIEWDVTIEQLSVLYEAQGRLCAISGIHIEMPIKGSVVANCASLDRIDSEGGYTIGNVQWVDRRINFMKQRMTDSDFVKMCKLVAAYNE